MFRLAAVFTAVWMLLVGSAVAVVFYFFVEWGEMESAAAGLAALVALMLYTTLAARLHDRNEISDQIADLSRLNADLAKQMAEIKHSLAAAESKLAGAVNCVHAVAEPVTTQIGELSVVVKQLAETVAAHEAALAARIDPDADATGEAAFGAAQAVAPDAAAAAGASFKSLDADGIVTCIREAIEVGRMDIYLQPVVTLPHRKVRFYEALTRLRTAGGEQVMAEDFIPHAEAAGLVPRIDNQLVFRSVQILRRLLLKNHEIGLFCNVSVSTLGDPQSFAQLSDFMDANRAIAPSLMFEFRQDAYRSMGPVEYQRLASLAERGFRFSMDHVTDLRMEPSELALRGFRFLKVPGAMLLKSGRAALGDIKPAELSDLLARHHIELIAERIENDGAVVDLIDFDVRFAQGFLFSPPRPVRAEAMQAKGERRDAAANPASGGSAARRPGSGEPGAKKNVSSMGVVA